MGGPGLIGTEDEGGGSGPIGLPCLAASSAARSISGSVVINGFVIDGARPYPRGIGTQRSTGILGPVVLRRSSNQPIRAKPPISAPRDFGALRGLFRRKPNHSTMGPRLNRVQWRIHILTTFSRRWPPKSHRWFGVSAWHGHCPCLSFCAPVEPQRGVFHPLARTQCKAAI